MNRMYYYLIGVVAVFGIVWFSLLRPDASASLGDITVDTAQVERGSVAKLVLASGTVRALTTVEVGSQVSGQIFELNADYNSEVMLGDIIALIDPQSFQSRVESANADVQSARANLAVQTANIASAEANFAQAERDYVRQKALFDADAVAQSTLEDIERALAVAQANLDVTRAQLQSSNATLSQRLASLRSAELDLDRTIIRSPIDGVVISRNVDVGQTVAASFSAPVLFTIAQDLEEIRIDAAVVEADIGGINAGDIVTFTVDAYPDQEFSGEVEQVRLASEALQNVVTYTVVIEAQNHNERLLPGMTANVEITVDHRDDVLRIADAAVRFRPPVNGPSIVDADEVVHSGERGQGTRARDGDTDILAAITLDPNRQSQIEETLKTEMRAIRESMGEGRRADPSAMRQRMQKIRDKVLRDNLTSDELKKVKAVINQRPTTTRVDVYVMSPDGQLEKKSLVIGLQDGSFAEIVRGAEVGDTFVTGILIKSAGQ